MLSCKVCDSGALRTFVAREMMFGMRDTFEYQECGGCASLQIAVVPDDLSKYYPPNYYSLQNAARTNPLKRFLQNQWYRHLVGRGSLTGSLIGSTRAPRTDLLALRDARVRGDSPILDVGSGASGLLYQLADLGFTNLLGIDPYLKKPVTSGPVRLEKKTINEIDGSFDAIFFNHSLEHIADPVAALARARQLLAPQGRIVVRVPVANRTWQTQGVNWVELDAPRHLVIFAPEAVGIAAKRAGLSVISTTYDTTGFELWGTQLYQRDIPLMDPRSPAVGGGAFSRRELRQFDRAAARMNVDCTAGRACFVLVRAP